MAKKKFKVAKKHFFNFNNLCFNLILEEPFYADVLRNLIREETDKIPTAAVGFDYNRGRFKLMVNPEFMSYLRPQHQRGVIKHEIFHIIFNHLTSRRPEDKQKMRLWNIATDLAINSHLANELPNSLIIPSINPDEPTHFWIPGAEGPGKNFVPFKTAEAYMREIMKDAKASKCVEGGGDSFDSHEQWGGDDGENQSAAEGEGSPGNKEGKIGRMGEDHLKRAEARRLAESARNEAMKKSWGSVSQEVRDKIDVLLKREIDWKSVLRFFVKKSQRGSRFSSFKRINKRWRDPEGNPLAPGRRVHRHARIAVCVDESGSMSDTFIANLVGELGSLSKFATFTVIPFDTEVCEEGIFEWKKGEKLNGHYTRTSRGGTSFDAPVSYVNDSGEYDGIIIMTDLCAPTPKPSQQPRLWITSESYLERYDGTYLDTGRDVVLTIPND